MKYEIFKKTYISLKKIAFKSSFVFALVGILLAFASAIIFFFNKEFSSGVGVFSTVISILLGIYSIIYTYVSGQETLKLLQDIKERERRLVDKINHELSKDNYDRDNINSLSRNKQYK